MPSVIYDKYMAEGIDVSKYQGFVTWKDVKAAGKEFAVARSSIGMRTIDETFVGNYTRMRNQGLIPGAYHLVVGDSTGAEQAANWKAQLDAAEFDKGLLVLDVEGWSATTNGLEAGTLQATEYLCQWVRDTYNRTPIIYTGVYWRDNLKQHPDNFGSELWLSYYGSNPVKNYVPAAWDTWKIWQYSSTGTVPGVTGDCDLNRSAGTLESLQQLAGLEWDEMATETQIRNIIAEEVARGVTTVNAASNVNTSQILLALGDAESRLAQDIANNKPAETMTRTELLAKFTEVLDAVFGSNDNMPDYGADFDAIAEIVNNLHSHVCTRVDLHV